jgi:hypothetical protein
MATGGDRNKKSGTRYHGKDRHSKGKRVGNTASKSPKLGRSASSAQKKRSAAAAKARKKSSKAAAKSFAKGVKANDRHTKDVRKVRKLVAKDYKKTEKINKGAQAARRDGMSCPSSVPFVKSNTKKLSRKSNRINRRRSC